MRMRSIVGLVAVFLLSGAIATPGEAQSTPNQVNAGNSTGTDSYNAYGGVRENINLATGDVSLQLPLLTLPGRNGHHLTLGLTYDSKIWSLHHSFDPIQGDIYWWDLEERLPTVDGIWRLDLPLLEVTTKHYGNGSAYPAYDCWTNFVVTLSDGSKHTFGGVGNGPRAGCYSYSQSQGNFWVPQNNTPSSGGSRDTAYMVLDTSNQSDAVLYLKDGTRLHFPTIYSMGSLGTVYSYAAAASMIVDADGNTITISSGSYQPGYQLPINSITDTLGRVVNFTYGPGNPFLTGISYKDSDGTSRTITFSYGGISSNYTFVSPPNSGSGSLGTRLSSITLPNGLSYQFQYNTSAGELSKITYPTGGYTRYDYATFTNWWETGTNIDPTGSIAADFREVTARYVCRSATGSCATEDNTTYTPTVDATKTNNQYMDVIDALGNKTRSQFSFRTNSDTALFTPPVMGRETMRWIYQLQTTLLRTIQTDYNNLDSQGRPGSTSLPIRATTTLNDTNQVSKIEWDYDTGNDNVIEQREYDYGSGAPPGAPVRKKDYTWLKTNSVNGQNYTVTPIYNITLKATEAVYDGASNLLAQSQFEYDNFTESLTASGAVQHDSAFGTSYTTRGKLTAAKHWRNTDSAWLTTRNQYDDAGNLRKVTDPLTHATTFSYTDSWANATCAPTGGNAAAYLTSATNALSQTSSATYNSCSGARASATDLNSKTTNFTYDSMGRLTQTNLPDNGQATRTFNEGSFPLSVTNTVKVTSTLNLVSPPFVDGLGRVTTTRLDSDPQGTTYTDVTYDALGRKATVSNPYRTTSDPTYGITSYQYDALGRVTLVIPPDGSQTTNNVSTTYSGNCSTATDQAWKKRKACTDALGRLTQVFEPDTGGNFIYETDYQYDVLNNLLRVDQKGNDSNSANWRARTFTYNSLSQLLTASNPESGTITYTYDDDGNVLTKKDARNITTTHTYDALHRLTGKTFSNGDQAISYFYDQTSYNGLTITNGTGRRTGMSDAAGTEAWSYDSMGRVLTDRRTTNGVTKTTGYTYNLDGSLATITYPSGRVITYTPNAAGRMVSAVDTGNSINYALSASYTPHGMLASIQNGASLVSTFYFNNRLQPCRVSVKSGGTAPASCTDTTNIGNVLDFTYSFSLGTADNGNVTSIANNRNHNRDLSYTYDQLNRIATAQSAATSGSDCWGLSFGYDIWANLLSASVTKCSVPTLSVGVTAQNKINNTGFSYDAAGNLAGDGSFSYTWDAESRMKSAAGVNYTYDGDDRRVQKSNGKLYWYGAGNDPITETDAAGNNPIDYIFFGGKRIARRDASGNVTYYFADHLGTARVVTNAAGTILDDSDFYPFGGEHVVVSSSGNNYKFTGKERDAESGLDEFGARYYSSAQGRFASPDWSASPSPVPYADLANPQTLNLYTYVQNNPLTYTDPTGHMMTSSTREDMWTQIMVKMGGNPEGCIGDGSCSGGTQWEVTINREGARTVFDSQILAEAYIAAAQAQPQNQPLTSVTVLGNTVGITYGAKVSAADQLTASNAIAAAAGLINKNASSLTADEKKAIGQISSFSVVGPKTGLGATGKGSMTVSIGYIKATSSAWIGSLFGHEGQHYLNAGKYSGANLWRDEQSAGGTQLGIGNKLGFTKNERQSLELWIDDKNRTNMQQHMDKPYIYP